MRAWIKYNHGKFIAALLAGYYLLLVIIFGTYFQWAAILQYSILPLACIFFSDEINRVNSLLSRPRITGETPSFFIVFMGWVLLTLPIWLGLIQL